MITEDLSQDSDITSESIQRATEQKQAMQPYPNKLTEGNGLADERLAANTASSESATPTPPDRQNTDNIDNYSTKNQPLQNPPTLPPNTGDTDIDGFLATLKLHNKDLNACFDDAVAKSYLRTAITKKLRSERLDELKQLGFDKRLDNPIIYCGGDNPITLAERMAQLQVEEKHNG